MEKSRSKEKKREMATQEKNYKVVLLGEGNQKKDIKCSIAEYKLF